MISSYEWTYNICLLLGDLEWNAIEGNSILNSLVFFSRCY